MGPRSHIAFTRAVGLLATVACLQAIALVGAGGAPAATRVRADVGATSSSVHVGANARGGRRPAGPDERDRLQAGDGRE